tara:strand:+ start:790 stop:960 length:171 start_codon:yes stop_codon:yes gene_type:complete
VKNNKDLLKENIEKLIDEFMKTKREKIKKKRTRKTRIEKIKRELTDLKSKKSLIAL